MNRSSILLLTAFLAVVPAKGAGVRAVSLSSEFQADPIGIDYPPQLSWKLCGDGRGILQTAYRIIISESEDAVASGQGDFWDSGRVESGQSTCISTAGLPFRSRARYFWKVKVWQNGEESPWSETASFEMGLTDPHDWIGGWIGYVPGIPGRVQYFKGNFWLEKPLAKARAYVAGIGFHEVYVNHRKVGDMVMAPAQSTYSKRVYYETYDLTGYLDRRINSIVIPVAQGWMGSPRLRVQMEVTYADGSMDILSSDAFRHVTPGPTVYSTVFDGECFDSNQDFAQIWEPGVPTGLMDKQWAWAHNTDDPVGALHAARVEPIRAVETIRPKMIPGPSEGIYVFDAGRNLAGWAAISVHGDKGDEIHIKYAETLRDDGSVNQDNLRNAKSEDIFICSGSGRESWEPSFTYHGFRYFQVEGLGYVPSEDDFAVKAVRTDVARTGQFKCSDSLANRIHRMVVNTESSNMHSVLTDCPQRDERMGWLNDLTVSHEIAAYNFDMSRFFPKIAQDITDTQDEYGAITCVAPFRFGMRPADPVCASYLLMAYSSCKFYGNRQVVADQFDGMRGWVDYLYSRTKDGIVDYSYYGDWCPPREFLMDPNGSGVSRDTPGRMISTGYLYYCSVLLSEMAGMLGKDELAALYREKAEATCEAFNAKYWDEEAGGYASNNQAGNAFAIYMGLARGERASRALENIVRDVQARDYHLTTGNLCTKYLLDVLAEGGYTDVAWKLVTQTTYPGWGFMLSKGATTVWERWEYLTGDAMNSHNHPMMGTVDPWFYKYLLGILPEFSHPGFSRFTLKPCIPSDLSSAEGSLDTVKGKIVSEWSKKGNTLNWTVEIPAGSIAEVWVPCRQGATVSCDSKKIKGERAGVYVRIELGSGRYEFKSRL